MPTSFRVRQGDEFTNAGKVLGLTRVLPVAGTACDRYLVQQQNLVVGKHLADLQADTLTVAGPPTLDTAAQGTAHTVPRSVQGGLNAAIAEVIGNRAMTWGRHATGLFERAANDGYHLFIVGGTLRDLLTGTPAQEINDLDLCGDVPADTMRRWIREIDLETRDGGRRGRADLGQPDTLSTLRTSLNGVTHGSEFDHSGYKVDLFEYAMLKVRYGRFVGNHTAYVFGNSIEQDLAFRDVAVNAMLYQYRPNEDGLLIDPSGAGLSDLGLKPQHLGEILFPAVPQRVTPVPVPADVPPTQHLRDFGRCLQLFYKWRDHQLDPEPFRKWCQDHSDRIVADASDDFKTLSVLCEATKANSVDELTTVTTALDWLLQMLPAALLAVVDRARKVVTLPGPALVGTGLAAAELVGPQYGSESVVRLTGERHDVHDDTREAAHRTLSPFVGGYRPQLFTVDNGDGARTSGVLGMVGPTPAHRYWVQLLSGVPICLHPDEYRRYLAKAETAAAPRPARASGADLASAWRSTGPPALPASQRW